jgi:hypothetical protein
MEKVNEIIGETIPFGPIEMAGKLKPAVDSGTNNINWGKLAAILVAGAIVGGLLYYFIRPDNANTLPKENDQSQGYQLPASQHQFA